MADKRFYEQAECEIKTSSVDSGVWAKAKARAAGEEKKIEALYLQLRAADLAASHAKTFPSRQPIIFILGLLMVLIVAGLLILK
jgi:hypothetical protein